MTERAEEEIRSYLADNDDLRKSRFRNADSPLEGHCYVATEAIYHVLGGRSSDHTPCVMKHEGVTHWFLRTEDGDVIDLTSEQFNTQPNYEEGRGCGMQNTPSNRCIEVLEHLNSVEVDISSEKNLRRSD